jgi:hypothetical protein
VDLTDGKRMERDLFLMHASAGGQNCRSDFLAGNENVGGEGDTDVFALIFGPLNRFRGVL